MALLLTCSDIISCTLEPYFFAFLQRLIGNVLVSELLKQTENGRGDIMRLSKWVIISLLLIMFSQAFSSAPVTITEKTSLVILAGQIGSGWSADEVDYLLSILEEQVLKLERFRLFSRANIQQIMKERNMSEIGVSEAQAIEIGKIGGSKYALLLTLSQLSSAWSNKSNAYVATSRYTIRLYNIENGELLASKALESTGKSEDTEQQSLTDALKSTASSIWSELKNIFKLEAYVKSVTGDNIVLGGLDPKIVPKGTIFSIETRSGTGYVQVTGYSDVDNTILAKFVRGEKPAVNDVATEFVETITIASTSPTTTEATTKTSTPIIPTVSTKTLPEAPTNLNVQSLSSSQMNLMWKDSSNNEEGFKIERRIGTTGSWLEIAAVGVNVTEYTDTKLSPNTAYYYRIRAYNSSGSSNYSNESYGTTVSLIWQRNYGGNYYDATYYVQQTKDGGYFASGYTHSSNASYADMYVVKVDAYGNKVWEKSYGGGYNEIAYCAQQTKDGGYIVAGSTSSTSSGYADFYVLKLDSNGNKVWERTYGGIYDDAANYIQQTLDGGYIVAGYTLSLGSGYADAYVVKIDANGNRVWDRVYGGVYDDEIYCIQQTKDGGYIAVGSTYSMGSGYSDIYILKIDAYGNWMWDRVYSSSYDEIGYSVQQATDNGYVIAGSTDSFGAGGWDVYVIKVDGYGNKIWERTYGGTYDDESNCIQLTNDGGYIITGWTESYGAGMWDVYAIKTDGYGNKTWEKTYGGMYDDVGYFCQQTGDGGYIIGGYTESFDSTHLGDIYMIRTDENGNTGPNP